MMRIEQLRQGVKPLTQSNDDAQPTSVAASIAKFQQVAKDAVDEHVQAAVISAHSDRKKYNYVGGLERDLLATRAALAKTANGKQSCTFGALFHTADGAIANLNRTLQNLRKAGEVMFVPELFLQGRDDAEAIILQPAFDGGHYAVTDQNCFRNGQAPRDIAPSQRRGRSYIQENIATLGVKECSDCHKDVSQEDRFAVRGKLFHVGCVQCTQCGGPPRERTANVTFDGKVCCSIGCIQAYDTAHPKQSRG